MKSYQGVEILFFKWFLKVGFMIKYLFSKKLVYPKIFKIWILYQSHAQLVLVNIGAEDLKVFWLVSDVEKEERDNADGPRAKKRLAVFPKDGHLLVKKMKNLSIHVVREVIGWPNQQIWIKWLSINWIHNNYGHDSKQTNRLVNHCGTEKWYRSHIMHLTCIASSIRRKAKRLISI